VGEEPEEKREGDAQNEAGDDGEVKGSVFTAMDDVAGEAAEAQRQPPAEIKQRSDGRNQPAKNEEGSSHFA